MAQVFPFNFYEISKNTFSYRTPPVAAFELNRMTIKNDMIKAFQDNKISQTWKIFVINLCYNKYTQTLH